MSEIGQLKEENDELRKVVDAACRVVDKTQHLHHSREEYDLAEAVANYRAYAGPLVRG